MHDELIDDVTHQYGRRLLNEMGLCRFAIFPFVESIRVDKTIAGLEIIIILPSLNGDKYSRFIPAHSTGTVFLCHRNANGKYVFHRTPLDLFIMNQRQASFYFLTDFKPTKKNRCWPFRQNLR